MDSNIKRGDIYYADLSPVVGSEQGGIRPVLIVQNNVGNRYSPTVIAAAITSQINKAKMPTHITVGAPNYGLTKDSIILTEQIRTLDKRRLREKWVRSTKKPCGTSMKHWQSASDSARCRGKPHNGGRKRISFLWGMRFLCTNVDL